MYFSQLSHDVATVIFTQCIDKGIENLGSFIIFSGSCSWDMAELELKPRKSGSTLLS